MDPPLAQVSRAGLGLGERVPGAPGAQDDDPVREAPAEQQLTVVEPPPEDRRRPPAVLGGPQHHDDVRTVDTARIILVGGTPDRHARAGDRSEEQDEREEAAEEDGVTFPHRGPMLTAVPPRGRGRGGGWRTTPASRGQNGSDRS